MTPADLSALVERTRADVADGDERFHVRTVAGLLSALDAAERRAAEAEGDTALLRAHGEAQAQWRATRTDSSEYDEIRDAFTASEDRIEERARALALASGATGPVEAPIAAGSVEAPIAAGDVVQMNGGDGTDLADVIEVLREPSERCASCTWGLRVRWRLEPLEEDYPLGDLVKVASVATGGQGGEGT